MISQYINRYKPHFINLCCDIELDLNKLSSNNLCLIWASSIRNAKLYGQKLQS